MPYSKEILAKRLQLIRKDNNLDQDQLSEKAHVGKSIIVNAELANGGMRLDSAFDLTGALGCTLDQLVGREDYVLKE